MEVETDWNLCIICGGGGSSSGSASGGGSSGCGGGNSGLRCRGRWEYGTPSEIITYNYANE